MGARQRLLAGGKAISAAVQSAFLDFQPRIQTGERILKYHLDILTHPLLLLAPGLQDVITMETNMAGLRPTRRMRLRPVVDLPQPDSPTSDSVSPGHKSKLTFSTAWICPAN